MAKRKDKRKHNYVVGFTGEKACVYGKDVADLLSWTDPMTLRQARRQLKRLQEGSKTIYELKPITE